jgi:hypothetical protein
MVLNLRIINLALEVDLILGSKLTSSAPLDVQAIINEAESVSRIGRVISLQLL